MPTNPIDLTTVAAVNDWLGQTETVDPVIIQTVITNYSQNVLTRTGRRSLSEVGTYTDLFSGNGKDKLFLLDYPIQTVTSLVVNGTTVPQSTAWNVPGWAIDPAGESCSLVLLGNPGRVGAGEAMWQQVGLGTNVYRFWEGRLNISVTYTAGYASTPFDLQQAATELVALMYRRRQWIGQTNQMQPNVGTTAYLRTEMEIGTKGVIDRYTKKFVN